MQTTTTPDIQVNVNSTETWYIVLPTVASFLFLTILLGIGWCWYNQKQNRRINAAPQTTTNLANKTIPKEMHLLTKKMKRNAVHPTVDEEALTGGKNSLHPLQMFTRKGRPLPLARVSPIFMSHPTDESIDKLKPIKSHNDIFNIYTSSLNDPHLHRTGRRVSNDV